MKRLFTFAFVALLATLAFAQSQQAQRRVAYTTVERAMQVGQLGPQSYADIVGKAEAANELGQSRLVRSANPATGYQQLGLNEGVALNGKLAKPATATPYKAPAKVTETDGNLTITKDANGLILDVEGGTTKYYQRAESGQSWYANGNSAYYAVQSGVVTTVEDGNNVYILNPISRYTQNTWVKGVKEGSNITVATYQPLAWSSTYSTTISLRWGKVSASGSFSAADDTAEAFTFAVNGDVLTLQGTSVWDQTADCLFMGSYWDDDDSFAGYGDAATVLTLDPTYTPPSTTLVELPEGVTAEGWYLNANSVNSNGTTAVKNQAVNVAFDGNDVYVQGFFTAFPDSWVKGTKNGANYEFENLQYIGEYDTNHVWMIGYDSEASTFVAPKAAYDATAKTLTFDCEVLANGASDRVYYLTWLQDVVLSADEKEYQEPVLNDKTATLPYLNSFDTEDEQAEVAIYDANEDDKTFSFQNDTKTSSMAAKYAYNSSSSADDYLVFPAVQLEAGKKYTISMDVRAQSSTYAEKVSVVCGNISKVSAMTTVVIPETEIANTDYDVLSNSEFTVAETGMYNFAVKCSSDADRYFLWVDNFQVNAGNPLAPAAPADLAVLPDATGACKATVKVTAPSTTLGETALNGELSYTISVDGEAVVNGTAQAGAAVSEEITVEAPGTYAVSVVFSYAAGESEPVTVKQYIGVDLPTEVTDLVLADKSSTVGMTWDAPQEGVNGGIFFPEQLKYNIYPITFFEFWGMVFPEIDYENPYELGVEATNYDLEYNTNEGDMQYTYFAVAAENEAGVGDGIYRAVITGAPYALPVKESCTGGALNSWWATSSDEANYQADGGLYFGENPSDGDDYNFQFVAKTAGWLTLESGKIALGGAVNPVAQFDVCGTGSLEVYVVSPAGEAKLQTIELTADYTPYTVSLVDYKDADWVRVIFKGVFAEAGTIDMDNIKIVNLLDHNLAVVGMTAPGKVNVGNDIVATVTVENQGSLAVAAADYTVKFTVNGEEVTVDGKDLAVNEKAEFTHTIATSAVSADAYVIKAEVVYAADEDQENNASAEVTARVALPNYPTVDNLTATADENVASVKLAWSEPNLENVTPDAVTDDFESYEPFQFGNAIGDWTLVDGDGAAMGGLQNMTIPNLTVGETTGSFFLFNTEDANANESFAPANGGVQYLATMFSYDGETPLDDWLISPALPGVAQTISFYAKSYSASYKESFEVLYSTTDMATTSFTNKLGEVAAAPDAWTEYTYELPEGAKYFAIHCNSADKFMLFVDDITYTPANGEGADLEIVGYNVYRNGEKLNAEPVAETEYTDADLALGTDYDYAVTAVYTQGESKAVHASATTTGIESIDVDAANATYYNLQGVQVAKPATGTTCIRVINGKAVKVIIR